MFLARVFYSNRDKVTISTGSKHVLRYLKVVFLVLDLNNVFVFFLDSWTIALDFLLVKQKKVCTIANSSCYTYKYSDIVEKCTNDILQQAKWPWEQSLKIQVSTQVWDQIKSWLPSTIWFLLFLGSIVAIILLIVFGHYILNLLVKFVSSRLESIILMKIKLTFYHGPLDNPSHGQL
jgi:hypothetical protein